MLSESASCVPKQFMLPVENAARDGSGQGLPSNNEHKRTQHLWTGPALETFVPDCDIPSVTWRSVRYSFLSLSHFLLAAARQEEWKQNSMQKLDLWQPRDFLLQGNFLLVIFKPNLISYINRKMKSDKFDKESGTSLKVTSGVHPFSFQP